MAKGFNLTAEINLRGPSNIRTVVADIKRQVGSVSVSITPSVNRASVRNISNDIRRQLGAISTEINIRANTSAVRNISRDVKQKLGMLSANIQVRADASSIRRAASNIRAQLRNINTTISVTPSTASARQAASNIRRQLGNINANVRVNVSNASIRQAGSNIRRQLGSINANINIGINNAGLRGVAAYSTNLRALNGILAQTTVSATNAAGAIATLTAAMGAAGRVNLGRINVNLGGAGTAARNAAANITLAGNEVENFGRQSGLAIRRFAAFSVVTGVVFGITNAIKNGVSAFIEYDQQLTRISQVTGDAKESLGKINSTISSLSTSLGVSSKELAATSVTLAQAGLTARDTETALKALALSALAPSFDDMNQTVEGSIALMRQFGISSNELEGALGSINAVAAKFAVEASDIITAIQRTGGVFAAAGKGVSEGTGALNEFIAVFTSIRATTRESAETIATGLRTIFTRIQRADTIEALKEFGVTLTDLEGKFVGPYVAVQRLSEGLSRLDPRDLSFSRIVEELGGFRQIGKVLPLIQQFSTAQDALRIAQQGQGSLAADAAKGQLALAVQISKVREEFLALVRSVGNTDSFQMMVRVGLDLASALIKVADAAKGLIPLVGLFAAFRGAQAITQFAGGFGRGFRGPPGRAANGGYIRRYANGDMVDVALMPGETVVYPETVNRVGSARLRQLNHADTNGMTGKKNGGPIAKFSSGGYAQVPGTGRTDSYYTQLPVGSFVVRTDATEALGGPRGVMKAAGYKAGGRVGLMAGTTKPLSKKRNKDSKLIGNIDSDFLRNSPRAREAMQKLGFYNPEKDTYSVDEYRDSLANAALAQRQSGNISYMSAILGPPGSGKSTLGLKGRGSHQYIETVEDIHKMIASGNRVVIRNAMASLNEDKIKHLSNYDRIRLLSASTPAERKELQKRLKKRSREAQESIALTGIDKTTQFGRKHTISSQNSSDMEAMLRFKDENGRQIIDESKIATHSILTGRRKKAHEVPMVRYEELNIIKGGFGPVTLKGHVEGLFKKANKDKKSLINVGPDEALTKEDVEQILSGNSRAHGSRTLFFDRKTRKEMVEKTVKDQSINAYVSTTGDGFGLPSQFNVGKDPKTGQMIYVQPNKQNSTIVVGEDRASSAQKYRDLGYPNIQVVPRGEGAASASAVRDDIFERKDFSGVSPSVGKMFMEADKRNVFASTEGILPKVIRHVDKKAQAKIAPMKIELDELLASVPGGRLTKEFREKNRALSSRIEKLRGKISDTKSWARRSGVHGLMGKLRHRYPERYDLSSDIQMPSTIRPIRTVTGKRKSYQEAAIGGEIQHFTEGDIVVPPELTTMGRSGLIALAKKRKITGFNTNILDPRMKLSAPEQEEKNKFLERLTRAGIIQQKQDETITRKAERNPVGVVGLIGDSRSPMRVTLPPVKDKKTGASIGAQPAMFQTGALPRDMAKQVQRIIRTDSEMIARKIGALLAQKAGSTLASDKQIRQILKKQMKVLEGLFFETGLAVAGAPYNPKAKAVDFGSGLGKELGTLVGIDANTPVDAKRDLNRVYKDVPKILGQFSRGQLESSDGANSKGRTEKRRQRTRREDGGKIQKLGIGGEIPIMAQVGEFVINKKSAKSIGYSNLQALNKYHSGGVVGSRQTLAVGGAVQRLFIGGSPAPAARPNISNMNDAAAQRVVGVTNAVTSQLQQLAGVLQELGITSSSTSQIIQRGTQATYAQAISAYEADIRRARIAGASAQQIAAAESMLRDIRQQADRDIRARRQTVDTPGGPRASLGSLNGGDLQRIESRADQIRQRMIEQERNRLQSMTVTRGGVTTARYSDQQVEERIQRRADRFNRQSYEQATTAVTGGRVNLGAVGLTGDDAQRYIQQSMRDRNTLSQMDRTYIPQRAAQIRQQLAAERGVSGDRNAMRRLSAEALRMAQQEARDRASTVRANARANGATAGGGRGGLGTGFGLSFGIQMLGSTLAQQINPESSLSNAKTAAAIQGFTNTIATGSLVLSGVMELLPESIREIVGVPLLIATVAAGIVQSFMDARNAAIEFEKKLSDKRVQDSMERVAQGFDKLSKNIKDIKIQDDITKNLIEASINVRKSVEADKTTAKAFWTNVIDAFTSTAPTGMNSQQAAASRSQILEKKGMGAYFQTTSIGQYITGGGTAAETAKRAEERRATLSGSMIPERAKEESKKYAEVAQGMQQIIEDKLRSGLSVRELLTAPKHEFEQIARTMAMADQATHAQILAIQEDTSIAQVEKEARIKAVASLYAEDKIRKSAKTVDTEKSSKNFEKNVNNMSRSLERMFQNMDQAIEKTSFSLRAMSQNIDLISSSLGGQGKTGETSLRSINVLQNPRAYSGLESGRARDQAASFFTGERNLVKGLLSIGDNLETSIMSSINKTLTDNPAASNEQIGINIERQVTQQIAKLQLPPDVGDKLGEQVKTALDQMRKRGDENINFDDLMEKIPALSKVLESGKKAQESALKALEHWQSSLNSYSEKINQLIDLQIDTNDKLRRSSELVINGNMEVARVLGKDISVSAVKSARNVGISQRTGGATNPDDIARTILTLESRRRSLESSAASAGNRGLAGANDFVKFKSGLLDTNVALRENIAALKSLAENGEVASAALGKIQEAQQKQSGKVGFIEKLVTSTPEEVDSLQRAMGRLQNNINGQLNTINNSVGAQKAYNDAIEQGATRTEAMSAAQTAFANERKETLGALNDLLPFLSNNQQGNEIKANVLESMARESGVGINPMIQQVLNSLRNPQADPETQAAMQQYQAAINEQSRANTLLAKLNETLANDIATKSAEALTQALVGASITFKNSQLDDIAKNVRSIALKSGDQPVPAAGKASGGIIYAAAGTAVNFRPQGTDTVPAMLTPGEFVVNRAATSRNLPLLESINSGNYSRGGSVRYYSSGGYVSPAFKNEYLDPQTLETSEKRYIDPEDPVVKSIVDGGDKPFEVFGGWKNFTRLQPATNKYHSSQYKKSILERFTGNLLGSISSEASDPIPFDNNGKLIPGSAPVIKSNADSTEYEYARTPDAVLWPSLPKLGYLLADRVFSSKQIQKNDIDTYQRIITRLIASVPPGNIWGIDPASMDFDSIDKLSGGSGGLPYNPNLNTSKPLGMILSRGGVGIPKISIKNAREGIQKIYESNRVFTGQTGDASIPQRIYGSIKGTVSAGKLSDLEANLPDLSINEVPTDNDLFKWVTDSKPINEFKDIQKQNIKLLKDTSMDVLGRKVSWLKNVEKNDKLISLQQKLEKIYDGGSLIESIEPAEKELLDNSRLGLDSISGRFSLLSRQLEPQLSRRVFELSRRPPEQQLPSDKTDARVATLTRIGGAAKWADGYPFPINYNENGLTKPVLDFPWIANIEPEYFLQNIKEQQEKQEKDRASGKNYGFDISSTGLMEETAKLPAPLNQVSVAYKAAYTRYNGRLFNLRQKELDNARPLNDIFLIDPKHDDPLNIFRNADFPDKSFFTGFPGPYQSGDLAKRIIIRNPQAIMDYMQALRNNDPNADALASNINNAYVALGPALLRVVNDKPLYLPEDIFYGFDNSTQNIDISKFIVESAKDAVTKFRGFAGKKSGMINSPSTKTNFIAENDLAPVVQRIAQSSIGIFGRRPGMPYGFLYKSFGRALYNITNPEKAKEISSQISNTFGELSNIISKTSTNNTNEFAALRDTNILATGAANVFSRLASVSGTDYIKPFLNGGSSSIESLFRSLGSSAFFNEMGSKKLGEDFSKQLGISLKGSKKATVGNDGSIALAEMNEQDLPKTYQDLVNLAVNPYHEFSNRSIRQSILQKLITDIPNFRASRDITDPKTGTLKERVKTKFPQFSPTAQRMITQSLSSLSQWYGGNNMWPGQDYLYEEVPGTTFNDRAQDLAMNFDGGLYTKASSAHRNLGGLANFGDIPNREWLLAKGQAKMPEPKKPQTLATGGMVYAANGQYVNFQPRGTDTVPAMLTPGEFVVNRSATQQHLPLLQAINSGASAYSSGGVVYAADGTPEPVSNRGGMLGWLGGSAAAGWAGANTNKIGKGIWNAFTSPISLRGMGSTIARAGSRSFPWTTAALRGIGSLGVGAARMGARGAGSFLGVQNIRRAFGPAANIPALQAAYEAAGDLWAQSQNISAAQLNTQPWLRGGNFINGQGQLASSAQNLNQARQALDTGIRANSLSARAARGLPLVGRAAGRVLSGVGFGIGAYEGYTADTDRTGRSRLTNTILGAATGSGTTMGDVGATSITGSQFGGNLLQAGLTTAQYAALGVPLPLAAGLAAGTITAQEVAGLMGDREKAAQSAARATRTANRAYMGDEKHFEGLSAVEAGHVRLIANLERQLEREKVGTPEYDRLKQRIDTERSSRTTVEHTPGMLWGRNTTTSRRMGFTSGDDTLEQAVKEQKRQDAIADARQAEEARQQAQAQKDAERAAAQVQARATVTRAVGVVQNVYSMGMGLFNKFKADREAAINQERSKRTRMASEYLNKPATPDMLEESEKLKTDRQSAIDEVKRLDGVYEQESKMNKDRGDSEADLKKLKDQYERDRKAALQSVARIDTRIIDQNKQAEAKTTPQERDNAWKQYADNQAKQARDEQINQARYQRRMATAASKRQLEGQIAIAQILRVPKPTMKDSPEAFMRWTDEARRRLSKKFRLSGNTEKDMAVLSGAGLSSDLAQSILRPVSKEQGAILMQMMASQTRSVSSVGANGEKTVSRVAAFKKEDLALLQLSDQQVEQLTRDSAGMFGSASAASMLSTRERLLKKQRSLAAKTQKQLNSFEKQIAAAEKLGPEARIRRQFAIQQKLLNQGLVSGSQNSEANQSRLRNLGMSDTSIGFIFSPQTQQPPAMNKGGIVYASEGTMVPYSPRGTDTVPAMLTPGEFVVNARATSRNLPLLQSINKSSGGIIYRSVGGTTSTPSPFSTQVGAVQSAAGSAAIRKDTEAARMQQKLVSTTTATASVVPKIAQNTGDLIDKKVPELYRQASDFRASTGLSLRHLDEQNQFLEKKTEHLPEFDKTANEKLDELLRRTRNLPEFIDSMNTAIPSILIALNNFQLMGNQLAAIAAILMRVGGPIPGMPNNGPVVVMPPPAGGPAPIPPVGGAGGPGGLFFNGGIVYASNGMLMPYAPRGTDTVPAMLTPGEFVVNRAAAQANLPLLHAINNSKGGDIQGFSDGGLVYLQQGSAKPLKPKGGKVTARQIFTDADKDPTGLSSRHGKPPSIYADDATLDRSIETGKQRREENLAAMRGAILDRNSEMATLYMRAFPPVSYNVDREFRVSLKDIPDGMKGRSFLDSGNVQLDPVEGSYYTLGHEARHSAYNNYGQNTTYKEVSKNALGIDPVQAARNFNNSRINVLTGQAVGTQITPQFAEYLLDPKEIDVRLGGMASLLRKLKADSEREGRPVPYSTNKQAYDYFMSNLNDELALRAGGLKSDYEFYASLPTGFQDMFAMRMAELYSHGGVVYAEKGMLTPNKNPYLPDMETVNKMLGREYKPASPKPAIPREKIGDVDKAGRRWHTPEGEISAYGPPPGPGMLGAPFYERFDAGLQMLTDIGQARLSTARPQGAKGQKFASVPRSGRSMRKPPASITQPNAASIDDLKALQYSQENIPNLLGDGERPLFSRSLPKTIQPKDIEAKLSQDRSEITDIAKLLSEKLGRPVEPLEAKDMLVQRMVEMMTEAKIGSDDILGRRVDSSGRISISEGRANTALMDATPRESWIRKMASSLTFGKIKPMSPQQELDRDILSAISQIHRRMYDRAIPNRMNGSKATSQALSFSDAYDEIMSMQKNSYGFYGQLGERGGELKKFLSSGKIDKETLLQRRQIILDRLVAEGKLDPEDLPEARLGQDPNKTEMLMDRPNRQNDYVLRYNGKDIRLNREILDLAQRGVYQSPMTTGDRQQEIYPTSPMSFYRDFMEPQLKQSGGVVYAENGTDRPILPMPGVESGSFAEGVHNRQTVVSDPNYSRTLKQLNIPHITQSGGSKAYIDQYGREISANEYKALPARLFNHPDYAAMRSRAALSAAAAKSVVPSASAYGGMTLGATLGSPGGPAGIAVGGILGGIGGGILGMLGQEKALNTVTPGPNAIANQLMEENPAEAMLGSAAVDILTGTALSKLAPAPFLAKTASIGDTLVGPGGLSAKQIRHAEKSLNRPISEAITPFIGMPKLGGAGRYVDGPISVDELIYRARNNLAESIHYSGANPKSFDSLKTIFTEPPSGAYGDYGAQLNLSRISPKLSPDTMIGTIAHEAAPPALPSAPGVSGKAGLGLKGAVPPPPPPPPPRKLPQYGPDAPTPQDLWFNSMMKNMSELDTPAEGMTRLFRVGNIPRDSRTLSKLKTSGSEKRIFGGREMSLEEYLQMRQIEKNRSSQLYGITNTNPAKAAGKWFTDAPEQLDFYIRQFDDSLDELRAYYKDIPSADLMKYNVGPGGGMAKFGRNSRNHDREFILDDDVVDEAIRFMGNPGISGFNKGGVVYASTGKLIAPQYAVVGKMINFEPRGTDTIPAMLTPGEFVVNREATRANLPLLQSINQNKGGVIYRQSGGGTDSASSSYAIRKNNTDRILQNEIADSTKNTSAQLPYIGNATRTISSKQIPALNKNQQSSEYNNTKSFNLSHRYSQNIITTVSSLPKFQKDTGNRLDTNTQTLDSIQTTQGVDSQTLNAINRTTNNILAGIAGIPAVNINPQNLQDIRDDIDTLSKKIDTRFNTVDFTLQKIENAINFNEGLAASGRTATSNSLDKIEKSINKIDPKVSSALILNNIKNLSQQLKTTHINLTQILTSMHTSTSKTLDNHTLLLQEIKDIVKNCCHEKNKTTVQTPESIEQPKDRLKTDPIDLWEMINKKLEEFLSSYSLLRELAPLLKATILKGVKNIKGLIDSLKGPLAKFSALAESIIGAAQGIQDTKNGENPVLNGILGILTGDARSGGSNIPGVQENSLIDKILAGVGAIVHGATIGGTAGMTMGTAVGLPAHGAFMGAIIGAIAAATAEAYKVLRDNDTNQSELLLKAPNISTTTAPNTGSYMNGGIVYASNGRYINFEPRGTDTVPAMLTPGEFVVNRAATQANLPLLRAINNSNGGNIKALSDGGVVYVASGGILYAKDGAQVPQNAAQQNSSMGININDLMGASVSQTGTQNANTQETSPMGMNGAQQGGQTDLTNESEIYKLYLGFYNNVSRYVNNKDLFNNALTRTYMNTRFHLTDQQQLQRNSGRNYKVAAAYDSYEDAYGNLYQNIRVTKTKEDNQLLWHEIAHAFLDTIGAPYFSPNNIPSVRAFLRNGNVIPAHNGQVVRQEYFAKNPEVTGGMYSKYDLINRYPWETLPTIMQLAGTSVFENNGGPQALADSMATLGFKNGGIVYASNGMMIPYQPRGTDTVPAMLTPGEFVINRQATQQNLPLLQAINSGHMSTGGLVYMERGSLVGAMVGQAASFMSSQNNLGQIFTAVAQSANIFVNAINMATRSLEKYQTQVVSPSSNSVSNAGGANASFSINFDKMTEFTQKFQSFIDAVNKINPIVRHEGNFNVNVNINGASVLAGMSEPIRDLVSSQINYALGKLSNGTEGAIPPYQV